MSEECPVCDSRDIISMLHKDNIQYGSPVSTLLPVLLPVNYYVHTCKSCHFSFTTEESSVLRDKTVTEYLISGKEYTK